MAEPLPWGPGVTVFLHVLGAALWVGGSLTLVVVNRLLKRRLAPDTHRDALSHVGRRAMPVLLGGVLLSALTGLELLRLRGYPLNGEGFAALAEGTFGAVLGWKSLAILLSVGAAGVHGILAARGKLDRRGAATLGIVTVGAGLLILFLGGMLRWVA